MLLVACYRVAETRRCCENGFNCQGGVCLTCSFLLLWCEMWLWLGKERWAKVMLHPGKYPLHPVVCMACVVLLEV